MDSPTTMPSSSPAPDYRSDRAPRQSVLPNSGKALTQIARMLGEANTAPRATYNASSGPPLLFERAVLGTMPLEVLKATLKLEPREAIAFEPSLAGFEAKLEVMERQLRRLQDVREVAELAKVNPEIREIVAWARANTMPLHLWVDVPSVIKNASLTVFIACVFSLITYGLTGFIMIHPFVSVLLAAASSIFYWMGEMLYRSAVRR
jgi:hypothetical protein